MWSCDQAANMWRCTTPWNRTWLWPWLFTAQRNAHPIASISFSPSVILSSSVSYSFTYHLIIPSSVLWLLSCCDHSSEREWSVPYNVGGSWKQMCVLLCVCACVCVFVCVCLSVCVHVFLSRLPQISALVCRVLVCQSCACAYVCLCSSAVLFHSNTQKVTPTR